MGKLGFIELGTEHTRSSGAEVYSGVIESEEQRVALNGLTAEAIARARANQEIRHFSSKGVDAFGSAKRYLKTYQRHGRHDQRTQAAERVFDYDILTGLFEETERVHSFSVSYPIEKGKVMMGGLSWDHLAANGLLDLTTEGWYRDRGFAEVREAVIAGYMLEHGVLDNSDIVTISNTATASNAEEYFSGQDLMVRCISFNKHSQCITINTLMMHSLSEEIISQLFNELEVPVDTITLQDSEDSSAKYLATQIKVKKGELTNGAADIGFLLDCIATKRSGKQYLFGQEVKNVYGNPYAELFQKSRAKEVRRQAAVCRLKSEVLRLVQMGDCSKDSLQKFYEDARSHVADIEGEDFVGERYGKAAAEHFRQKKLAIEAGDWGGASGSEHAMQIAMGDVVICYTVFSKSKTHRSTPSLRDALFCPTLPKPGDITSCPCCRKRVRVAGTRTKIACPTPDCSLEDRNLRRRRLRHQQEMKIRAQAVTRKKSKHTLKKHAIMA